MKWIKKGMIICAEGQREWMMSHIQNPYVINLQNGDLRIFFTTRGRKENNLYRANIAYIDVDRNNLTKVIRISDEPVMKFGKKGTFDEFGMMPGCIINKKNELWLYYVGWTREISVPYSWSIGLAISKNEGKSFERFGDGPIIGKSYNDPYLQNGCTAVVEKDGTFHMFYSSGIGWIEADDKFESQYILRHACSKNGIEWIRDEDYCIPLKFEDESQTSPTIIELNGKYHMFFPYRHSVEFRNAERGYRIGYAVSSDLIHWQRLDVEVGIDTSETGWDSEMVCYPHICRVNNDIVMFYCGNGFGVGGLGYAILSK